MVGTGIWAEEMAREFPKAEIIGLDLAPYEKDWDTLPSNLSLVLSDALKGLPYPDRYFDVVHARMILGGIRDWTTFMTEVVRVVKPGGLMVLAETEGRWPLRDQPSTEVGSGFVKLLDLVSE